MRGNYGAWASTHWKPMNFLKLFHEKDIWWVKGWLTWVIENGSPMSQKPNLQTGILAVSITAYKHKQPMESWKGKPWKTFRSFQDIKYLTKTGTTGFCAKASEISEGSMAGSWSYLRNFHTLSHSRKCPDSVYLFPARIYNSKEKITLEILEFERRKSYNLFHMLQQMT